MFNMFTTLSAVALASLSLLAGCDRKPAPPPAPVIDTSTPLPLQPPAVPASAIQ